MLISVFDGHTHCIGLLVTWDNFSQKKQKSDICGGRGFQTLFNELIKTGFEADLELERKENVKRDGDKQKYRRAGKEAGQIDKIEPQSNTEGRQINRQPDRQSRQGCAARWAS